MAKRFRRGKTRGGVRIGMVDSAAEDMYNIFSD